MSIDDFLDFDVYDEHLLDSPKLKRYRRHNLVGKINDIASFSFELSQDVIDFLQDADTALGVRAIESIRSYTAAQDNRKYGIMRSHRIISIASSVKELSAKGAEAVLDELDDLDKNYREMPDQDTDTLRHNGALTFIKYVNAASECIRKNTGREYFLDALHTLALTAISDATKIKPKTNPAQAFLDALSSGGQRSYAKSAIGKKISFQNLPTGLKKILEYAGDEELESYKALLDLYPSAIHIDPDQFDDLSETYQDSLKQFDAKVKGIQKKYAKLKLDKPNDVRALALDEKWEIEGEKKSYLGEGTIFGYISNWVGSQASKERFRFFWDVYQRYGDEGVCKLGKPLLTALYKKSKDDPKLVEKIYKKILPKIYAVIPKSNKRAPKWLQSLHKNISKCDKKNLEKVVDEVLPGAERILQLQKQKALRKHYEKLVAQIKKGNPLKATEYLCRLHPDILEAMQTYEGTKTDILKSMGTDLVAVNQVYVDSALPPDMVIGLYNSGRNSGAVFKTANNIDEKDKSLLAKLKLHGLDKMLFSIGNDTHNLEELLKDVRGFKDLDYMVLDIVYDSLSAPVHFVAGLDDDQKNALTTMNKEDTSVMLQSAYPKYFKEYAHLHMALGIGNLANFLSDKVNLTLEKYSGLSQDERIELTQKYFHSIAEGGSILRVYGHASDKGYDKLMADCKRVYGIYTAAFSRQEDLLKKFTDAYLTLDEKMQETLLEVINDAMNQSNNNLHSIMSLAPEELPNNSDHFFTMWGFVGQGYQDTTTLDLAERKDVQQKYLQIEPAYKKVWVTLIRESTDVKKFLEMPSVDFYLAAEAYEFALQSKKEEMFLKAFDECVGKGTVNKWAKTIIEYFREHSKGAGHYRNLVEQDRALTAV